MKRMGIVLLILVLLMTSGCSFPWSKKTEGKTEQVTEDKAAVKPETEKEKNKEALDTAKDKKTADADTLGKFNTEKEDTKTASSKTEKKLPMETLKIEKEVQPAAVPVTAVSTPPASPQEDSIPSDSQPEDSTPSEPSQPAVPAPPTKKPTLSYEGYALKWEDDFEGEQLNTADWNYETHEKGWVNNELQEYVASDENVYLENGKLVIKPIKTGDGENAAYTSGRINTQGKHDFTYGLFEVVAKVPAGQGFLPAFWMMPVNENVYGQWPRCGEIDIMEVLGSQTKTAYGTIHYGNPHRESQGSYTVSKKNFAETYHKFSCEWFPDKINWYIDGVLYHTENDWYSKTVGQGEVSYPAPFDQPFYMILNLAVGGNWPGNPDAATDFDAAAFTIDSVKVYQKDNYDDQVKKPEKEVVLRNPDKNGNYVNNSDFGKAESLKDGKNWEFMNALEGAATAKIRNKEIIINTTSAGTADYSVQLVQAGIPIKKGAAYELSFDAYALEDRTMKTAVTAPDYGYVRYLADTTLNLTTTKQTYCYSFKMKDDSDANGRLEFNMGAAGSMAEIHISNVKIKMVSDADPEEKEEKTILADGNYVYNGSFQEGSGRMGYWEIDNQCSADLSVTGLEDGRRLKVQVAAGTQEQLVVGQSDLALSGGKKYVLSFDAQGDGERTIQVKAAGETFTPALTADKNSYSFKFETPAECSDKNLAFYMGTPGTTYLDNVRIVEDTLIKNGDFSAGFAGYEVYVDSSADASYVIDSLSEDSAADFTIRNTGDQDWKIQMKQNNVELKKGQWYKLSFQAKASVNRKIRVIMQGSEAKGWAVYSGENTVALTDDFKTFEKTFQMGADTDPEAFLSVCYGKIDQQITTQHRVCLDNISLEEVEAPPAPPQEETEGNLLKNGDFSAGEDHWINAVTSPGEASAAFENNQAVYNITNAGTADWNVQLKQEGISLEKDADYKLTFKAKSTAARTIKTAFLKANYDWYGGEDIALDADTDKNVEINFKMNADSDSNTTMVISMGKIDGEDTLASTITLSDFKLIKVNGTDEPGEETQQPEEPGDTPTIDDAGELIDNGNFANALESWETYVAAGAEAVIAANDNKATFDIANAGANNWDVQLKKTGIPLVKGHDYKLTYKVTSTEARSIKFALMSSSNDWYGGDDIVLEAGTEKEISFNFTMNNSSDADSVLVISMGKSDGAETPASVITLSDFSLQKIETE